MKNFHFVKNCDSISDHLSLRNIFKEYKKSKNKYEFCKENFLNDKALAKSMEIFKQLKSYLEKIYMDDFSKKEENEKPKEEEVKKTSSIADRIKNLTNLSGGEKEQKTEKPKE